MGILVKSFFLFKQKCLIFNICEIPCQRSLLSKIYKAVTEPGMFSYCSFLFIKQARHRDLISNITLIFYSSETTYFWIMRHLYSLLMILGICLLTVPGSDGKPGLFGSFISSVGSVASHITDPIESVASSVVSVASHVIDPIANVASSTFSCAHNCWHNDWRTRDRRAERAGCWSNRHSYPVPVLVGGRCYCCGCNSC